MMLDTGIIRDSLPLLATGATLTLQLAGVSLVLATAVAIPLAFQRRGAHRAVTATLAAWSFVMRGTPLLVQIYILYYGLPQIDAVRASMVWPLLRDPVGCAILAITLNASAYLMELFAGAIAAVPRGEIEAAKSLGLGRWQRTRLVVLPRAARMVLPAYGNEVVLTLKATSLASTITLMELTGSARIIVSRTYAPYEVFVAAALIYLASSLAITGVIGLLAGRDRSVA